MMIKTPRLTSHPTETPLRASCAVLEAYPPDGETYTAVRLPYPLSTNRLWRNVRGRQVLSAEARRWKEQAGWAARAVGLRCLDGPVAVAITLHPRLTARGRVSQTRLDLDNPIKAALDALNGIAWTDDRQVTRIVAEVGHPLPDGGLTVFVSPHTGN